MSAQEKLQKAIEAAIIAGYSLNSEAFEFLTENSENMDPRSRHEHGAYAVIRS